MTAANADHVLTIDRFVTHVSTVSANKGQTVGLFVRERLAAGTQRDLASRKAPVILCIHGGFLPSAVAYDLPFKDYSVMEAFARAGYDVFAMTHTGYGSSPKPMMDDPCNVAAEYQHLLIPHVLKAPCPPRYPYKLVSSQTELDEIETVARFIMDLRGVKRISLFGWSTGAPRAGSFAATHPDKVDKLVMVAPAPFFPSDTPPDPMPEPGAPMILQSWDFLMGDRWENDCHCEGQVEHAEIRDVMWRELMAHDGLGASWGAEGRGIMRAPNRMLFGWRANVPKITAPTLILLGEFDNYQNRLDSWKALRAERRVFVKVQCASHFLPYERVRHVLHRSALEWYASASLAGETCAEFYSDPEGALHPLR
ncbi:MAG: alpha/beta hydrolase [Variibacter sp.]|nr:alpha/beta hydrolase [Variibacter sp.]